MATYIPIGFWDYSMHVADDLGGLVAGSRTFLENGDMVDAPPIPIIL